MIFTLLAEVVAVYVQFTIVYIRHLGLKGSFALFWRLTRSLVRLQVSLMNCLNNLLVEGGVGVGAREAAGE